MTEATVTDGNTTIDLTPTNPTDTFNNQYWNIWNTLQNIPKVNNPYDPSIDYFAMLGADEKYKDKDGDKEYPYLKGLQRLAHSHRGGIKAVRCKIAKVPAIDVYVEDSSDDKINKQVVHNPDCIAACTVSYEFNDGTTFEGSADASFKAHKAPFNLHLVAVAESKAEARAIRRAFNIRQVSKEEMGEPSLEEDEPITDAQIEGIKNLAARKKVSQAEILKLIKKEKCALISDLTKADGIRAMKALNKHKGNDE